MLATSFNRRPGAKVPGTCLLVILATLGSAVGVAAQQTNKTAPAKAAPAPAPAKAAAPARPGAPGTGAPGTGAGAPAGATNRITTNGVTTANRAGNMARPVTTTHMGGTARPVGTTNMGGTAHPAITTNSMPHRVATPIAHQVPGPHGPNVGGAGPHSRDIVDPHRNMVVHHDLHGGTHVVVDRPDHSRIVAERGRGYVQRPYSFGGREYEHRTYVDHGRTYDRVYAHVPFYRSHLDVYAPGRFYRPGFYRWAGRPWGAPVRYNWGWAGNPWYGYYGVYFTPYPVYAAPSFWLTDYLVASSLQAAYAAQAANAQGDGQPGAGTAVITPEVKQQIADEVKQQLDQEQAQANAPGQVQTGVASMGVVGMFGDGHSHVLVAGSDLDLVDLSGRECAISQGDVVQVNGPPAPNATTVNAVVLASKGGSECAAAANVSVAVTDLQEMQNHMRETLDQGMAELQANQGQHGLPAAPSDAAGQPAEAGYAAAAPADANAAAEISQQVSQANQAEQDAQRTASAPAVATRGIDSGDSNGGPTTIALGQSIDTVKSLLGTPTRIAIIGPKKIYQYSDMKVTFVNDRVSNVE